MITNHELAEDLLRALDATDVRFSFLHGEERFARGELDSDIDVLVDKPVRVALSALVDTPPATLLPVLAWEYDGGALTSFWMTPTGTDVVQLDFLFDPEGKGKYGLRTGYALQRVQTGSRWPKLDDRDEATYVAVKRLVKGQWNRAATQLANAHAPESMEAEGLLAPATRAMLTRFAGGHPPRLPNRRVRDWLRWSRRLVSPAGAVVRVHPSNRDFAYQLKSEWDRLVPRVNVRAARIPWVQDLIHGARVGLVVILGGAKVMPPCDSFDTFRTAVVSQMTARLRERLRL